MNLHANAALSLKVAGDSVCNVKRGVGHCCHVTHQRPGSFEDAFTAYWDPVCRYAARRVAPEAVQDVVAETFVVAWRRFDTLSGEPLPWLLGIARRVASNHRRAGARRSALVDRLKGADVPTWSEPANIDSELGAALACLGALDREALLLVAWEGLDHQDAASVMGCSTGAFSVRLHRARRKLALYLAHSEQHGTSVPRNARSLT
jgi:RNA polymerase sigma-70 factor (ECF subfamily)